MSAEAIAVVAIILGSLVLIAAVYASERREARERDREAVARSLGVLHDSNYMAPWADRRPGDLRGGGRS